MNIEFGSRSLRECYEDFGVGARTWGNVVAAKFIQRVGQLAAAPNIQTLGQIQSLRLHQLQGSRSGEWSMTLHDRWRLVFTLADSRTVRIEEVSNHYGD